MIARWLCKGVWLALAPAAVWASPGACGMPDTPARNPADLAHSESDLSLAHMAEQPAGPVMCSMGYMAEKCGDHATALKIFDKCIAKGYAGAMIWKGLMLENGNGLPRDDAAAAALFKRAGEEGEGPYAALGKLHYASALHQGKGVPKDEAEARRWFERSARDGSEDAAEFLRTGYHTGGRDASGRGVGTPGEVVKGAALVHQDPVPPTDSPWWQRLVLAGGLGTLMLLGAWQRRRAAA